MTKYFSLASLLLVTSALTAPAWAQDPVPSGPSSSPSVPSTDAPTTVPEQEGVPEGTLPPESTLPPPADQPATPPPGGTAADAAAPDDEQQDVDISAPGADANEPIVVRGEFIPDPIRQSEEVVSVLSTEDIARTGEGDIAGALQRVSGLSLVGGRFVYVRGLGERYSLALLNGSPLPSPEPLRRVVPLDLFPTSVLASSVVQKSYSVNYTGEFGGGLINLTTRSVPDEPFLSIGGSISGDSETTLQSGLTYYGSDSDWTGFDDGTRDIPDLLQSALNSGRQIIFTDPAFCDPATQASCDPSNPDYVASIVDITQSFVNSPTTVVQQNNDIPANFGFNVTGGTYADIGSDFRVGVIATAGYSNDWQTRGGLQQSGNPDGEGGLSTEVNGQDFEFFSTTNNIVVNGLLGFGAEFGEHTIRWTNLYIRDTLKEARLRRGTDFNATSEELLQQYTEWFERQLISTQLVGEFEFGDLSVDLRGSYANAQREAPYERFFGYRFDEEAQDFVTDTRSNGETNSISFSDLTDDVYGGQIDLGYSLPTEMAIGFSAGYAYYLNQRSSTVRRFRYRAEGPGGLPFEAQQLRPDYLFSDALIEFYQIYLLETTGAQGNDAYDAELEVHAGYGQVDVELFPAFNIAAGVRYEDARQIVNPIPFFGRPEDTPTLIENDYWLPAGTITWNFIDDVQLRLSASKTIARPQFRELAFQVYTDPDSDRSFFGNPNLQDSEIFNLEGRLEWYFDRDQYLQVAGFYKDIDRPIEQIVNVLGSNIQTTFINAPRATLYGGEAELRYYLPLYDLGGFFDSRRMLLNLNYTYTKSEIKVREGDTVFPFGATGPVDATLFLNSGEPLTGQSDHVVNLQIGLEDEDVLSQQTILLNYASERVTNRAQNLVLPDIVERPGISLDYVARQGFTVLGRLFEFNLEVRNILSTNFEEVQELGDTRIDVLTYDRGTSVSLGLSTTF